MRQHQRALDRIEAALGSLPHPWTVLRETGIIKDGSRLGAAFVVFHPDKGIALVDLAPARPDAATTWLRVTLIRAGGGLFTVREPRITSVSLSPEQISLCLSRIEASFAGMPLCAIPDKNWPEVAVAALTSQHVGLVSLRRDRVSESKNGAVPPDHASQHAAFHPTPEPRPPSAQKDPVQDPVPPREASSQPPIAARSPWSPPGPKLAPQDAAREARRSDLQPRDQASRETPITPVPEQTTPLEPVPAVAEARSPSSNSAQLQVPRIDVPRYATRRKDFAGINVPLPSIASPALRAEPEPPPHKLPEASALRIEASSDLIVAPEPAPEPPAKPSATDTSSDAAKSRDTAIEIPPMPRPASAYAKNPQASVFAADDRGTRPPSAPPEKAVPEHPEYDEIRISHGRGAAIGPASTQPPRPGLYAERDLAFAPRVSGRQRRRSPLWLLGASAAAVAIILFVHPRETSLPEKSATRMAQAPTQDAAPTITQSDSAGRGALAPNFDDSFRHQTPPAAPGNPAATPQQAAGQPQVIPEETTPTPSAGTSSLAANSVPAPKAKTGAEAQKAAKPSLAKRARPERRRVLASNAPLKAEDEAAGRKSPATPKIASDKVSHRPWASNAAKKNSEQADAEDQNVVTIQGTDYVAGREPRPLGSLPSQTEVASAPGQPPPSDQPVQAQSPQQEKPPSAPLPPNTDFAITPSGIMGPSGVVTPFGDR